MKRLALFLAATATAAWLSMPAPGLAAPHEHEHGAAAKATSLSGEVVDMGCYIGHASKGAKHADCAAKCIAGGMPMGVLTAKGDLYLLMMDHGNPDAYNKTKEFAGKQVKITGPVHEKKGMKSIEVSAVEAVAMAK